GDQPLRGAPPPGRRLRVDRELPAAQRSRARLAGRARKWPEADLASHRRALLLQLRPGVRPVAQEDCAAVLERAPGLLLRRGDHRRWRGPADDGPAQPSQPRAPRLGVQRDAAFAHQLASVSPDGLEGVAVEALVLPALPEEPGEAGIARHRGPRELA